MWYDRQWCVLLLTVLDTALLVCNDTVLMSGSSTWSVYVPVSPPHGWYSYFDRQRRRGGASVVRPPFAATCPLTVAARPGQTLNLTVLGIGQYGVQQLDITAQPLLVSTSLYCTYQRQSSHCDTTPVIYRSPDIADKPRLVRDIYTPWPEKNGPPKHVKITLWIENVSDYFSLYHEMPSICNVHVKFHDN